jgi:mono/diheme cytochrome c family protein
MRRTIVLLAGIAIGALPPPAASAQDVAAFYEENCAACHTIGGGAQAGPDLKGVTARRDRAWLIRFLVDTGAFASDPAVVKMIEAAGGLEMPPTPGMTPALAEEILRLIERQSGEPAAEVAPTEPLPTPADAARGRGLFLGTSRLSNAGPACVACHDARSLAPRGGRLGPDLAAAHQRLGGARGLTSWLGGMPTPMMRALYREAPLTEDEGRALAAFLASVDAREASPAAGLAGFVWGGALAALAVVAIIGFVWSDRFRAVRRPMLDRPPAGRTVVRHAPGAATAPSPRLQNLGGPR